MNVAQHDLLRLTAPDAGHHLGGHLDMEAFDPDMNFEPDGLLDHPTNSLPSIPFTPSYEISDAFSTTFEDPFSYQSGGPYESILDETGTAQSGDSASADPDNKLLSFGAPILKAAVLDDQGQTWPTMSAELYGMFFVAEDVFGGETTGRPMELTCYRRNLFQISGMITLSRSISQMVNAQGQHVPVYDLQATISALESIEGKSTEIISVPWKTNNGIASEDKSGAAPPRWPLDLSMNPELDPSCVSIPIAWKRLQFKHATANNGRRKGLQQHYIIQINLMATLPNGEQVKLSEIQSGPIIVRGRSPRNFDSRKDVPLSERKVEPKQRTASDASLPPMKVDPAVTNSNYRFYSMNGVQGQPPPQQHQQQQQYDMAEWPGTSPTLPHASADGSPTQARQAKKMMGQSSTHRPPIPKTKWKAELTPTKPSSASAPIDLSLVDDDHGRSNGLGSGVGKPSSVGESSPIVEKGRKLGHGSPVENADLLYEYFPLSLDDWMPPVDAIYRPHVVHHTILPPDLKAAQLRNKTKRYFTAED